jgi:hypothetical protein
MNAKMKAKLMKTLTKAKPEEMSESPAMEAMEKKGKKGKKGCK